MLNFDIQVFITVAEAGSLTAASHLLYISPTAIMKRINNLENQLGIKLFNRSHHGLTLTGAGRSFYQDSKFLSQHANTAINRARAISTDETFIIRVAFSLINSDPQLMNLLDKVNQQDSRFEYEITSFDDSREQFINLIGNLNRSIDLIAGSLDFSDWINKLAQTYTISKKRLGIIVSPHNQLFFRNKININDLDKQSIYITQNDESSLVKDVRKEIKKTGINVNWVFVDRYDIDLLNQCSLTDILILASPEWANVHPLLKSVPINWSYQSHSGFIYAKNPNNHVKEFIKILDSIKNSSTNI